MAISFSRPDPSSPAAVGSAAFPVAKRGFDQGEVRDFLRMVAAELARLQEREKFLEGELRALQTSGMSAPGRLDEETVTTLLGEEAARVLSTARDASAQIRQRAEEQATRLVKEAAEDAARIRESAMVEAVRIRDDAAADAESEIDMAKQQGRDMVNEAREYREKVLSELSRRRDAARKQIEDLLHGRNRLMNAFERARIASENVLSELVDAHDEPEFIVDLSPTTGPIPVINPAHPSVIDMPIDDDAVADAAPEVVADVIADVIVQEPSHEELMAIETEIRDAVDEVETIIADAEEGVASPEMEHPVHQDPVPHDAVNVVVEEEVVSEPSIEVEPEPEVATNVVSLFGRQRASATDEKRAEQKDTDRKHAENTDADIQHTENQHAENKVKADDIFARLRAGSTDKVADKVTEKVTEKSTHKGADKTTAKADTQKSEKQSEKKPAVASTAKAARPLATPADPALFAARSEALAPVVVAMVRKMKRVLADEQNAVLGHLRQKRSALEIDAIFGTVAEQTERYVSALSEESLSAGSAGAASMKSSGGSSRRVTQKAIDEHVRASLTAGLIAEFREDARIAIGEAEGDREVLAGLVRDVYRKWKMDGIDAHVDDVACAAHARGSFLALEQGARVEWMMDPANPCCSECEDNSLGGDVARGEGFPTGHEHPPAHRGCRCLVRPARH